MPWVSWPDSITGLVTSRFREKPLMEKKIIKWNMMKSPNNDIRHSHAWVHTSMHVHLLAQGNTHIMIRNTSHLSLDLFIVEW